MTKKIYLIVLALVLFGNSQAQLYPVQATTQLVPPYSVYLADYATGANNQLRVLLLNKDVNQPGYKVKLKMTIELNGTIIMRTTDAFNPAPITIEPNQPYSVEGVELAAYLNSNNIDFIGYSKQEYEQKKGLPEGAYKICFTAYDYLRPDLVKVSNEACSYYYLSKNDPPFVNMPACGMFVMPLQNAEENLIDKAGRWLSYVLVIPWTTDERDYWYNKVNYNLTQKFDGRFDNDEAKLLLLENGQAYALERNKEWDQIYGEAWKNLVFAEFTKDAIEKWNRKLVKYDKEEYVVGLISATPTTAARDIKETDLEMAEYIEVATQGNTNITFMWTPRHTSSPNSTLSTKYRLQLYAINPKADNAQLQAMANNAVQTTSPVFTIDGLDATQFVYGPTEPSLIDGTQYAWRVQAYDASGRDWFKNNGYSEVCYFTFGGIPETNNTPQMEEVQNFTAIAEADRRGKATWSQTGAYTSYKVRYRKKAGTGNWFEVNTDSLHTKLYDLEPNTEYQAQLQGKAGQFYGPFTAIKEFKTPATIPPPGCGLPIPPDSSISTKPLIGATPFMIFKVGKFEFLVDSIAASTTPGMYTGKGSLSNIPFLNILQTVSMFLNGTQTQSNGGLKVQFTNIFVNENRQVTQGEVYAISRPLEEWIDGWEQYYEERRKEQQQRRNRELWKDLDSNAVALTFEYEISSVNFDTATGVITLIDANGVSHTVTLTPDQIGHDIIIQGANSDDQWVVRPDGSVHAVPGGGLFPGMNVPLKAEEKDVLVEALRLIKNENTTSKVSELKTKYLDSKTAYRNEIINGQGDFDYKVIDKEDDVLNSNNSKNKFVIAEELNISDIDSTQNEIKYLNAMLKYFNAESLNILSKDNISEEGLKLLASYIFVNSVQYKNYVATTKATKTIGQMAVVVRDEIEKFVNGLILKRFSK